MKIHLFREFPSKIIRFLLPLLLCSAFSISISASEESGFDLLQYQEYEARLRAIEKMEDIGANGFTVVENQIFPVEQTSLGDVSFIPAFDEKYQRLAVFLADQEGKIVYRTDQLETNSQIRGGLRQPNRGISAVSFQDLNGDGRTDIVLITSCISAQAEENGSAEVRKPYKVGDVLFQSESGFYRDYRLSDKINRFGMNKSIRFITSFVKEGYSTEFLYTATTLEELQEKGFTIVPEQYGWRQFEKLGKLLVAPGTYRMAEYTVFMVYLVNEQGYIVWSFQPMGDYENLYALKGVACKDIDGDGMKDIAILARYSYEDSSGETAIENDYAIYYQRTGGFYTDTELKKEYRCGDGETMEMLVEKARIYWGWRQTE